MAERTRPASAFLGAPAFLTLVPLAAHALLSPLGFNPTDDGFVLAYSRRILLGQVPHRDFIMIRPALSPLLHAPLVRWAGENTYLLSRLVVWLELAAIAWLWIGIIERLAARPWGPRARLILALIAFAATACEFPIMAWHTIDGLFLASAGLALCVRDGSRAKLVGYSLTGLACLCKQSFVFAGPLAALVLGDAKRPRLWIAMLAPGLLYAAWAGAVGALPDAVLQLTSQTGLLTSGLLGYLRWEVWIGALAGVAATRLGGKGRDERAGHRVSLAFAVLSLLGLSIGLATGTALRASFALFGLAGAATLARPSDRPWRKAGLIVLIVAWSSSISVGYNYPGLAGGALMTLLLARVARRPETCGRWAAAGAIAALLVVLGCFGWARTHHIYREDIAPRLTMALDGVLPGARGVRTNPNTYRFLAELEQGTKVALRFGKSYAILPDCPGWWVEARQANPLPIDWAQEIELKRPELMDRVIRALDAGRDTNIVIVSKAEARSLPKLYRLGHYDAVEHVRQRFTKIAESDLFELYR